jgi:hypothetical protein
MAVALIVALPYGDERRIAVPTPVNLIRERWKKNEKDWLLGQ